jgi:peptide-methionine (S)-S-oxide reductase
MTTETATFGTGCFWGVEYVLRRVPGVLDVVVGYAGGMTPNPTYHEVCTDTTGHAEVAQVEFDPSIVSYEQLLEVFWAMHDPTTVDRQGPDVGSQYRSILLAHTPGQRAAAEASKERAQARYPSPIATEIRDLIAFYPAEDYHQDYYAKTRHTPYCHVVPVDVLEELGLIARA